MDQYVHWAVQDAAIAATKVSLQVSGDQRGLFCTHTIYPDERILFLPAKALIGDQFLRTAGQQTLQESEENDAEPQSAEDWERVALGIIEEIRQLLDSSTHDDTAAVDASVKGQAIRDGYVYRGDDGVALYLIACRHILQHFGDKEEGNDTPTDIHTPSSSTPDEAEESDVGPELPLTEATPITEQSNTLVLEPDVIDAQPETFEGPTPTTFPSFLRHMAVLPTSFLTSPLCYNETELARIEGTNCHGYTTRMRQQIESDWWQLHRLLQAYAESNGRKCANAILDKELVDIVTLESYQWALCNIYSRSTDFMTHQPQTDPAVPTNQHQRVIAPLFDMMNHDFASDISHAMDTDGNLSVFNGSSRAIEPGEDICLSYGNFPNEKLLLIYGFAIPNNPFDAVSIFAPIPLSDPLATVKARILETKCGIVDTNEPHALTCQRIEGQSTIPASLLSVLRVVGIQSTEEILALASQETTESGAIAMISVENEAGALSALHHALYSMTRRLALNLISDDTIEKNAPLDELVTREETAGDQQENQDSYRPDQPTAKQSQALADAKNRLEDPNIRNAQILCQSEYSILQAALTELAERLAALDGSVAVQQ